MMKIRFATKYDVDSIIQFLKIHWDENSILVRSRSIFDYQYVDNEKCNFILAIDDEENKIYGLKGFIPFNKTKTPDIAAALAIVLQGVRPMLGMEIQRYLENKTCSRWICSTGLNPNTSVKIYELFKDKYIVGTLNHFYRLSARTNYRVAVVNKLFIPPVYDCGYRLQHIQSINDLKASFDIDAFRHHRPFKDADYLEHRYFRHPVYNYQVLGIRKACNHRVNAILVARSVKCQGAKVLRIVDYIGKPDEIAKIGMPIQEMIDEHDYEYVDFYCYGINESLLRESGFVRRDENDTNIIPNYFEPFVQKNIDIYYFCTSEDNAKICKADGDQDRPNLLPEGWCE